MLFISHSTSDLAFITALAAELRHRGLPLWVDVDDLTPGCKWMEVIESALKECSVFVIYIGRSGVQRWVDFEVRTALYRYVDRGDLQIIPILGRGVSSQTLPPFLGVFHFLGEESYSSVSDLAAALTGIITTPTPAPKRVLPEGHSPFPGLRQFGGDEAELFFGRDDDIAKCLDLLGQHHFAAVVGDSGSGKSSFLSAGLVPAVMRGRMYSARRWLRSCPVLKLIPSNQPFRQLAKALVYLDQTGDWDRKAHRVDGIAKRLEENPLYLLDSLEQLIPQNSGVLLVIDRIEDLFSQVTEQSQRDKFIQLIEALPLEPGSSNIYCLLGIRSDRLDRLWKYERLWSLIRSYQYPIRRMAEESLREIIVRPLALAGCTADPSLITTLLADVGDEPGNLALLQHALYRMWSSRTNDQLSGFDYDRIGRLSGVITTHANEIFVSLEKETNAAELEKCVQRWFIELTHLGEGGENTDTRRRVSQETLFATTNDILSEHDARKLLHVLVEERLLTVSRDLVVRSSDEPLALQQTSWIEVSHETLIRRWKLLREWIDVRRDAIRLGRRLSLAREEWERSGDDALLTGSRLQDAVTWRADNTDLCSTELTCFIDDSIVASNAKQTAQLKQRRRERILLTGIILFLVSTAVLLAVLYIQQSRERDRLQLRSDISASSTLAKEAEELWPADPRLLSKMEDWIHRAHLLLARGQGYQASLSRNSIASDISRLELQQAVNSINEFEKSKLLVNVEERISRIRALVTLERRGGVIDQQWQRAIAQGLEITSDQRLLPIGKNPATGLWEFVLVITMNLDWVNERATYDLDAHDGLILVLCPSELNLESNGDVRLLVSKSLLTSSQFSRIARDSSSVRVASKVPLTEVSWQSFQGILPSYGLSIPSEKEWDAVCRYDISIPSRLTNDPQTGRLGIIGIGGGIAEWCFDAVSLPERPTGSGDSGPERIICGAGAFSPKNEGAACTVRNSLPAVFAASDVGVRPVLKVKIEK